MEVVTNIVLNFEEYAECLEVITVPKWKKYTLMDRLQVISSAIFAITQLDFLVVNQEVDEREDRLWTPKYSTVKDSFDALAAVVRGEWPPLKARPGGWG